ncbi:MAG: hypothetical protein KIG88_00110, partial [Weeksellaceae bacterium]|nr:hypothetical protein [Weeksellaceae bacterium]
MKKILLSICILFSSKLILAQVGIGTLNPNISLEITEERNNEINDINSKDGILIPSLTKVELASKNINIYNSLSHGTLVYVSQVDEISTNLPSVNQVVEILNPGFYYFDGIKNKWISTVGDPSVDIWSNNKLNHYMELNGTSSEGNRIANSNVIINDKGYLGINSNYPTQATGQLDPNDLNDPIDPNKPNDPKKRLDIDAS